MVPRKATQVATERWLSKRGTGLSCVLQFNCCSASCRRLAVGPCFGLVKRTSKSNAGKTFFKIQCLAKVLSSDKGIKENERNWQVAYSIAIANRIGTRHVMWATCLQGKWWPWILEIPNHHPSDHPPTLSKNSGQQIIPNNAENAISIWSGESRGQAAENFRINLASPVPLHRETPGND